MSADPVKVAEAMKSVVEAHAVLNEFHKEVVAFYGIVEKQLSNPSEADSTVLGACLKPPATSPDHIVWQAIDRLDHPERWLSRSVGRFYKREPDPGSSELRIAFIWVVVIPADGAVGFTEPEVWFGVANAGRNARFSSDWDFGRDGLWNYLLCPDPPLERWAQHSFRMQSKFGEDSGYHVQRLPLSKLLDEATIRKLLTDPLRSKYDEVFGSLSP